MGNTDLHPESAQTLNEAITIAALIVGAVQVVFLYNLFWSYFNGKPSGGNPWRATTLEWQTPDTPPKHGNFGPTLPVVYRWAYDYSVPGAAAGLHTAKPASEHEDQRPRATPDVAELGKQALARRGHPQASWRARMTTAAAAPERHHGRCRVVAGSAHAQRRSVDRAEHDPDRTRQRRVCHGAGASRSLGVSRRRHVAVRAADQCLPHANDGGRLDHVGPPAGAVAEHRCARAGQRRDAMDAHQCATGPDGRGEKRPARRGRIHFCVPGGTALGVATIECLGGVSPWPIRRTRSSCCSTALHGIHLLGGLWVWARATARVLRDVDVDKVRLSVELCTVYWHFLLLVWAVLFAVLLNTHQ